MIIGGTGHRPKYYPCRYNLQEKWFQERREGLKNFILSTDPEKIHTGLALGWDTLLAQLALELEIPYDSYVPFKG